MRVQGDDQRCAYLLGGLSRGRIVLCLLLRLLGMRHEKEAEAAYTNRKNVIKIVRDGLSLLVLLLYGSALLNLSFIGTLMRLKKLAHLRLEGLVGEDDLCPFVQLFGDGLPGFFLVVVLRRIRVQLSNYEHQLIQDLG